MSNLKIDDVRYLVMEGGGARGTAYLGAIRSLQEQLFYKQGFTFEHYDEQVQQPTSAIMDYNSCAPEGGLHIKGVAGSSAGAITTYALALGMNSTDIEEVLNYPFQQFLSEKSVGKYRMVDENSELKVGEDDDKQLGMKTETFAFDNHRNAQKVRDNGVKRAKRNFIVTAVIKVVVDGVVKNLDEIFNSHIMQKYVGKLSRLWNFIVSGFRFLARYLGLFTPDYIVSKFGTLALIKLFHAKVPTKVDADIIGNVLFDAGMFSGFAVREFFYDMTLMALTRETHFRRCVIAKVNSGEFNITGIEGTLEKGDLNIPDFEIGERSQSKLTQPATLVMKRIERMTFSELFRLTGVDFHLCVSNLTTDLPVYFSKADTPDFRVMEAVAASMTIPPAIKPLFNEADVFRYEPSGSLTGRDQQIKVEFKSVDSVSATQVVEFVDKNGNFNQSDYFLYEFVVKRYVSDCIRLDSKIDISLNNEIDSSNFMPKLRELISEDVIGNTTRPKTAIVEGISYTVTKKLLHFFYNARYKGMLVDGGYRNNIPYNVFRTPENTLDGVLALKLDGSFPPPLMAGIRQTIAEYMKQQEAIKEYIEKKVYEGATVQEINKDPQIEKIDEQAMEAMTLKVELVFEKYLDGVCNDIAQVEDDPDKKDELKQYVKQQKRDRVAIYRLIEAVLEKYKSENSHRPWRKRISLLGIAGSGYSYGTEKGQIRNLSDHDHIIPLYDGGVGTFDFDMKKVQPMVFLSQELSKADTDAYFGGKAQ